MRSQPHAGKIQIQQQRENNTRHNRGVRQQQTAVLGERSNGYSLGVLQFGITTSITEEQKISFCSHIAGAELEGWLGGTGPLWNLIGHCRWFTVHVWWDQYLSFSFSSLPTLPLLPTLLCCECCYLITSLSKALLTTWWQWGTVFGVVLQLNNKMLQTAML